MDDSNAELLIRFVGEPRPVWVRVVSGDGDEMLTAPNRAGFALVDGTGDDGPVDRVEVIDSTGLVISTFGFEPGRRDVPVAGAGSGSWTAPRSLFERARCDDGLWFSSSVLSSLADDVLDGSVDALAVLGVALGELAELGGDIPIPDGSSFDVIAAERIVLAAKVCLPDADLRPLMRSVMAGLFIGSWSPPRLPTGVPPGLPPGLPNRPPGRPPIGRPDPDGDGEPVLPGERRDRWDRINLCEPLFQDARRFHPVTIVDIGFACRAQTATIHGSNFGSSGRVFFTSDASDPVNPDLVEAPVLIWSDNYIEVQIPLGAIEGPVTIQAIRLWHSCNWAHTVTRTFSDLKAFTGGLPRRVRFTVDGVSFRDEDDWGFVERGTTVTIGWDAGGGTTNDVTTIGSVVPVGPLSAQPPIGSVQLAVPDVDGAMLAVTVASTNACGTSYSSLWLTAKTVPRLAVSGVEATQGVQRFDVVDPGGLRNTARLISRRRTAVRAYIDSGLRSGTAHDVLVGVRGELEVWVNGSLRATVSSVLPSRVGGRTEPVSLPPASTRRQEADHSLWFDLPWRLLDGEVELRVTARTSGRSKLLLSSATGGTKVRFSPTREFVVGLVAFRPRWTAANGSTQTAAPPVNVSFAGVPEWMPIAEDGLRIVNLGVVDTAILPANPSGQDVSTWWNGMQTTLGQIGANWPSFDAFVGLLPDSVPAPVIGGTGAAAGQQYQGVASGAVVVLRATVEVAPKPSRVSIDSLAHELLHTLGIDHAFGGGAEDPQAGGEDSRLKAAIPTGQVEDVAVRTALKSTTPSPTYDVMSYSVPKALSIATTELAYARLEPTP